jgi:8-oxo-dGTP diphosphatase
MPEPVAVAVAVVHDARGVLVGKRPAGAALEGYWEFPGGKVGSGELPEVAAARECREETGLRVRIERCLLETVCHYPHGSVRLHFFAASAIDPADAPREPFRWVPRSQLPQYRFPPANGPILAMLAEQAPSAGGGV